MRKFITFILISTCLLSFSQSYPTNYLYAFYNCTFNWTDSTLTDSIGSNHIKVNNVDWTAAEYPTGIPVRTAATLTIPSAIKNSGYFHYSDSFFINQTIPIVLLYQNINYRNQIYCKFSSQVLTGNVESSPYKITKIAFYSTRLTGSDSTSAHTYFGVPTKNANKWVDDIQGNDSWSGTESQPYKTIQKAGSVVTAGQSVFIRSSIYVANDATYHNFTAYNGSSWTGLGYVHIKAFSGNAVHYPTNGSSISNIILDGELTASRIPYYIFNYATSTANKCMFVNSGTNTYNMQLFTITTVNLNYCVFNTTNQTTAHLYCQYAPTLYGCVFAGKTKEPTLQYVVDRGSSYTFNIKYCKFINDLSVPASQKYNFYFYSSGNINIIGNIFKTTNMIGNNLFSTGAYTGTIKISNNKFYINPTDAIFRTPATTNYVIYIDSNYVYHTGASSTSSLFQTSQNSAVYTRYNNVECTNTASPQGGIFFTNGTSVYAQYNQIYMHGASTAFTFGSDVSTASSPIYFTGNKIICSNYYDTTISPASHTIAAFRCTNMNMQYNFFWGGGICAMARGYSTEDYSNCIYSYNIFKNCNSAMLSKGAKNVMFSNNTILRTDSMPYVNWYSMQVMYNTTSTNKATGCKFKNNIIIDIGNTHSSTILSGANIVLLDSASTTGFESDYNVLYSTNNYIGQKSPNQNTYTGYSFSTWKNLGYDIHSININPTFDSKLYTKTGANVGTYLNPVYSIGLKKGSTIPINILYDRQFNVWDIGAYITNECLFINNNGKIMTYNGKILNTK